jgi:hypothetical protein
MHHVILYSFFLCWVAIPGFSQTNFAGTYSGTLNGDQLELTLQKGSGNALSGKMKDSQQQYEVTATINGNKLSGKAVETTWGIEFAMNGTLTGNKLNMELTLNVLGTKQVMNVEFLRKVAAATPSSVSNDKKPGLPPNARNDSRLVGTWAKEELYNSGYGDNYMGSSFTQSMIFYQDGSVADGGSQSTISGSNYSGNSQGAGSGKLPGVVWYNIDNQLYLRATQNGQTETVHLGKFYIENGKMLITGPDGKKTLLSRK